MDHSISGESSASSLYRSNENIKSIFADPLSSSGESALSPVSDRQLSNLSHDSIVESFDEISTEDVFTSKSGNQEKSGRNFIGKSDFQQRVNDAERICVRTPAYSRTSDLLKEHRSATVSGSLKDGKTTIALSLCHEYSRKGWNIYYHDFSSNNSAFLSASKSGQSLYVFENIFCSRRTQYELEKIIDKMDKEKDSAFLFTCLSFKLKESSIKLNRDMFTKDKIVDISSDLKHCNFVKWKILRKHPNRLSTEQVSAIAQQTPTHTGFPGLCKLFSESSITDPFGFFSYPHKHYQLLLTSLFQDKRKCCVFIILLLFGGRLYLKHITERPETLKRVKKLLQQIYPEVRMENLQDELASLYGIFLKESYHVVTFQYEVTYDAAVFVVDKMHPGFLWRHCRVGHVEDGETGLTNSFTGESGTIYITRSNSNQIISHLVDSFRKMQLKAITEHPVLHNNSDNVELFLEKLERTEENFISYEDPDGGNFLFWCMKSSCVDLQRSILNHRLLKTEDMFKCLAFELTQQELRLSESSLNMVLTKLLMDSGCGRILQDLLMIAASVGDVERVQYCIGNGARIALSNEAGETCLHLASLHGQLSVINALIDHSDLESYDHRDKKGMTPAMIAEERGFSKITELLLAKGVDPSVENEEGNALIHLSCLSGNVDSTRFLLHSKKQDVNLQGQHGRTPVMMAAFAGELEVLSLLEEYGCDMSVTDGHGDNILHMACLSGCMKVVEYILASDIVSVNDTNNSGRSCLMIASLLGNEILFDILLSKGCGHSLTDFNGNTTLHYAFFGKNVEYIKCLLSKNLFDVNAKGEQGKSPIMMAVTSGLTEIVDFVIKPNVDWTSVDANGNNALHEACRAQRLSIVKKIISFGVLDVNCRGSNKMTPAMFAAHNGNRGILEVLITANADATLQDGDGNTILHLASREGHTDMVLHIKNMNLLDINMKGFRSRSPLMMAVLRGHTTTVESLALESNLSDKDEDGHTPLVLACMSDSDNDVIVDKLIKADRLISDVSAQSTGMSTMPERFDEEMCSTLSLESVSNAGSDNIDTMLIENDEIHKHVSNQDEWTPIMHAAKVNNVNIVRYLCQTFDIFKCNGSKDNAFHVACWSGSMEVVEFLMTEYPELVNMRGKAEMTPLMIAALQQNHVLFKRLVDAKANPQLKDASDNTVLHLAASVGDVGLVELIVKRELCDKESKGQFGRTAVMIAARNEKDNVFDALIQLGCDRSCVDDTGNSILHVSTSVKILKKLIVQWSFNIDARNTLDQTPVMKAASRGHFPTFKYLFNKGTNIHLKATNGNTVLHEACISGNVDIVKLLIAQDDVDINATDSKGRTPVMFAAQKGHRDVFFTLVYADCDLWRIDNTGIPCYRFALKGENDEIVKYLEKSKDIHAKGSV